MASAATSVRQRLGSVPAAVWVVLAAGLALRAFEMAVYSTVVTNYYTGDAGRYLRVGFPGMFSDPWMPAGFPLFLRAIRLVSDWLPLTVAIEHLLGLGTAALLYAAARRAGAGATAALLPAAWVALSGDHIYLEQALLTETLWTLLLAAAVYAAVRADAARDLRWLAGAAALLGLATIVRSASEPLPLVLALWAAVIWARPWRSRVGAAAIALLPAAAVIAAYAVIAEASGPYTGLGEMRGWLLYQRVGQFADCSRFTPPAGTAGLCSDIPRDERPGQLYWYFDPRSPARRAFPALSPDDSGKAGDFARAAIEHQPLDYARAAAKDFVRFFDPGAGSDRPFSGFVPTSMAFDVPSDPRFPAKVRRRYSGFSGKRHAGTGLLTTYQAIFRINGLALVALFAFAAAALVRAGGSPRRAAALVGALGLALLVIAPLVSGYDARYAVPPAALLTVPAALGLTALRERGFSRTERPERG